jgi:hypothetical protein
MQLYSNKAFQVIVWLIDCAVNAAISYKSK